MSLDGLILDTDILFTVYYLRQKVRPAQTTFRFASRKDRRPPPQVSEKGPNKGLANLIPL